jgi:anti-sigma B factor antagonist
MPLTLISRHLGNVCIIECKGRIAMGDELKALEAALNLGTREFTKLVLNVGGVERLDSTGIGLLVRVATNLHKRGGDVRLAAPPPFVVNLLKLANLSSILQVHPTEEEALLSFLRNRRSEKPEVKPGSRVLFFDQSADLCAFVRAVLTQHGFDVKSTSNFGDAKVLLRVDDVDYVVVGPGTPQLSAETALRSLKPLMPKAAAFALDVNFAALDAHEATQTLLNLFGVEAAP